MINCIKMSLVALFFLAHNALALQDTHLVVIPGQNGMGGQNVREVLPQFSQIHYVPTPEYIPDLGQSRCLKYLKATMQPLLANHNIHSIIIHASSQGTATALNYMAKYPNAKVKALILEAILSSGNDAVYHTIKPWKHP